MVGTRLRRAGDGHVGVADGLDLLDPVFGGQLVEAAEQLVKEADDAVGIGPRAQGVKPARSANRTVVSG